MAQDSSFEATIQETLVKPLLNFADKLRRALSEPAGEDILATLQRDYREERHLAKQLRAHAALMPNDLFRDTLGQIAAETERHAQLLAEQLQALGGSLPVDSDREPAAVPPESTIWRLIAADIAAIGAISHRYQAQLGWLASPPTQRLLQDLRAAKHRHRQTLSDLLSRIDSYAKPEVDHRGHP
jgi:rubrerythrin